jgi:hypothetical protein
MQFFFFSFFFNPRGFPPIEEKGLELLIAGYFGFHKVGICFLVMLFFGIFINQINSIGWMFV